MTLKKKKKEILNMSIKAVGFLFQFAFWIYLVLRISGQFENQLPDFRCVKLGDSDTSHDASGQTSSGTLRNPPSPSSLSQILAKILKILQPLLDL